MTHLPPPQPGVRPLPIGWLSEGRERSRAERIARQFVGARRARTAARIAAALAWATAALLIALAWERWAPDLLNAIFQGGRHAV